MVTEPSPLPTASQAQHNPEVANPWILTQKKKKKKRKTSIEQIRNQSIVTSLVEKTKYSPYKAKANQTPLPNTAIQICLSTKKKKNPIQRKPNPRPRANQTHGETPTVTSLAGATRFVARRPCLLVVDSSLVRPSQCRLWQWYLGKEKGVVVWWVLGSVESLGCSIVLHPLA